MAEYKDLGKLHWKDWADTTDFTKKRFAVMYGCERGMLTDEGVTKRLENKREGVTAEVQFDREFVVTKLAYTLVDTGGDDNELQDLTSEVLSMVPELRQEQERRRIEKLRDFLERQGYTTDEIRKLVEV